MNITSIPANVSDNSWGSKFPPDVEAEYDPIAGMSFVMIPPGTFTMGSPLDEAGRFDDEQLPHLVTISTGFWLAQTPMTQGEWQAVMGSNPSYFVGAGPNAPVEQVSWDDCQEFIRRLNVKAGQQQYRIPTEAEWEYACRAGTAGPFYAQTLGYGPGNCNADSTEPLLRQLDAIAWWCGNAGGTTHPVAEKLPNAWGLHDMLGNVWEWCELHHSPALPPGALQAIRGGPWYGMPRCVRCADRHTMSPGFMSSGVGLRLVRDCIRLPRQS